MTAWLRRGLLLAGLLALGLVVACPPGPAGDPDAGAESDAGYGEPLALEEAGDLQVIWPGAARKRGVMIPEALLSEDDLSYENNAVWAIYDASAVLLGYVRDIFTPVHCVSGACQAIRFVLVYDPDLSWIEIYHPQGDTHPLLKYWDGLHVEFDAADWALLRGFLADPPAILVGVSDYADLVVGVTETAPTQLAYQDVVVRGAAFTTYQIVGYKVDTGRLLQQIDLGGLGAP